MNFKKDNNLLNGKGEEDIDWLTINGAHVPIKKGMSPKQAITNYFEKVEENSFRAQLEKVKNNNFDKAHTQLKLGRTPDIFIKKAGLPDLPLVMSYETAYLSMNKAGNIKGNYHNLGIDIMEQIPKALEKPLFILKSNIKDRVEAILNLKDSKERDIFVSIEFDVYKQTDGKHKNVNLVITAFGAKESYIRNRLIDGKIIYKKS